MPALLLALCLPAGATDPSADSRAAELAALRGQVETLSNDLLLRREDLRNRLKAIEAERLEIEVQLRREELRLARVRDEEEARRDELSAHAARGSALVPAVRGAIDGLRSSVTAGLPFRVPERLAELSRLEEDLDRGQVTPEQAVARLWAFTEDELRLTRENGLDRQVVALSEGEVLAEVARLGMVALYFRTEGGLVGYATREGGDWSWRVTTARDPSRRIEELFTRMQHGVRTGAFALPDPGVAW